MRATNATAAPSGGDIIVTLYDKATGSSICAILDLSVAENLALTIKGAAEDMRRRLDAEALP
jgi:hypothetical protein